MINKFNLWSREVGFDGIYIINSVMDTKDINDIVKLQVRDDVGKNGKCRV